MKKFNMLKFLDTKYLIAGIINTGNFSKIQIPLPDEVTMKEFHIKIEPIFDKIYKNQQQIRTLEKLRDTLLPKLMSGEVRVKY